MIMRFVGCVALFLAFAAAARPEPPMNPNDNLPPQPPILADTARPESKWLISDIAFSPDGRTLATAASTWLNPGRVFLWDTTTNKRFLTIGCKYEVRTVAFTADGKTIVCGGRIGELKTFDVKTGEQKQVFEGHRWYVYSAWFTKDGKKVVTVGEDATARVWDAATGKPLITWCFDPKDDLVQRIWKQQPLTPAEIAPITITMDESVKHMAGALAPDDTVLALVTAGREVLLADITMGKITKRLDLGDGFRAVQVRFSPDGKLLAVGGGPDSPDVLVWDLAAGKLKWRLKGHTGSVLSVAFSPDGKLLASGCAGKKLILWDVATGKEKGQVKVGASVYSLTFSPTDPVLGWSLDGLKLWDLRTNREHPLNNPIRRVVD